MERNELVGVWGGWVAESSCWLGSLTVSDFDGGWWHHEVIHPGGRRTRAT